MCPLQKSFCMVSFRNFTKWLPKEIRYVSIVKIIRIEKTTYVATGSEQSSFSMLQLRGLGPTPRNILKIRPSEIDFGGILTKIPWIFPPISI